MGLDNIQDDNAQRVHAGAAVPMLSASGQSQNMTTAGMGKPDTSAIKTAQALGTLASDVVGNAQAIVQKERFLEGYANAGAGEAIVQMKKDQPAWTTLFGQDATILGAQARSLENAVADFGNAGLSMVSQFRDKDPGIFHKFLSGKVAEYFTGDAQTDNLITQKATELIPKIAAAHYKENTKYVQELNVKAANKFIDTRLQTLQILRNQPEDMRNADDLKKAKEDLLVAVTDSRGMESTAFQAMVVQNAIKNARQGDATILEMLLDNFVLTDKQDERVDKSIDKFLQNTSDSATYKLKQGEVPEKVDPQGFRFTEKQKYEMFEGMEAFRVLEDKKHSLDAGRSIASLEAVAKSGDITEDRLALSLMELKQKYPTFMTEGKIESIFGMLHASKEKGKETTQLVNAYSGNERILDPSKQLEARRAFKAEIYKQHQSKPEEAERIIWQDWALGKYGVDNDVRDSWHDAFVTPFNSEGKPNKNFDIAWAQFTHAYKLNPDLAKEHIADPLIRARLVGAMKMIELGKLDATGARSQWAQAADLDARGVLRNPEIMKKLKSQVEDLTKGGLTRFVPFIKTGGAVTNITNVQREIQEGAEALIQYNGVSAEVAFETAASEYSRTHETIGTTSIPNGGKPIAQTMKLREHGYTADDAVQFYLKSQNIDNARVKIINDVAILMPCDEKGILTGKPSKEIHLQAIGQFFNEKVINVRRSESDAAAGRRGKRELEERIDAMINRASYNGERITREEAVRRLNAEAEEMHRTQQRLAHEAKELLNSVKRLPGKVIPPEALKTLTDGVKGIGGYFKNKWNERKQDLQGLIN